MRVVVLGGSGNFGARIVRALRHDPGIDLLSAGRRATPVPGAESVPVASVDVRAADLAQRLRTLGAALVIHCAGPFQDQDYTVARAAIQAGAHYLDLADGRQFVGRFQAQLDDDARRAGVTALTGVSTLPALSSAVIDFLARDLRLQDIHMVIAPGQRAVRGPATLAGVLSYLGESFKVWRQGHWQEAWGWMGLERVHLAVGDRLCAWCDVPDLELLPARYAGVQTVTFKAALEFAPQQRALWILAALRRAGAPMAIRRWARMLDDLAPLWDPFAGPLGGMRVQVRGRDDRGASVMREWQVIAPAASGPQIPCMPAILLAQSLLRGNVPAAGARACLGELTLAQFTPLFDQWSMRTQLREVS